MERGDNTGIKQVQKNESSSVAYRTFEPWQRFISAFLVNYD